MKNLVQFSYKLFNINLIKFSIELFWFYSILIQVYMLANLIKYFYQANLFFKMKEIKCIEGSWNTDKNVLRLQTLKNNWRKLYAYNMIVIY